MCFAFARSRLAFFASLGFIAVLTAVLAAPDSAHAVKIGTESLSCGGASSESASYRAHDTVGQCPIGPLGQGAGVRIYDGFWLTLPNINVPVEGVVYGVLSEDGSPVIRWTVGSLAGIAGFNVYRALAEDGPFVLLNDEPLAPQSPGSYADDSAWPQTTFWYEVRAVAHDGTEDALTSSGVSVTTGGALVLRLHAARPNPAFSSASMTLDIPEHAGAVHLVIYNVRGQVVRTLVNGALDRGRHVRTWDCCDGRGRRVASGVYLVRLMVDGVEDRGTLVVLR